MPLKNSMEFHPSLLCLLDGVGERDAGSLREEGRDGRAREGGDGQDGEGEGLVEGGRVDDVRREEHAHLAKDIGEGVALEYKEETQ